MQAAEIKLFLCVGLPAVEERADDHKRRKHDYVEQHGAAEFAVCLCRHVRGVAVGIESGKNHECAAHGAECGHDNMLEYSLLVILRNIENKHGNVKCINRNDRQFRRIEAEHTEEIL